MTEQQIDRDALRRKAKDRYTVFIRPDDLLALLDQLNQAEARIKAVRDVLDNPIRLVDWDDPLVPAAHVRRALDG